MILKKIKKKKEKRKKNFSSLCVKEDEMDRKTSYLQN